MHKLSPCSNKMHTCLIVIAGLQSLSSSKIDRQTVPEGYTFGWNKGGSNLPRERKIWFRYKALAKHLKASRASINYLCLYAQFELPSLK